MILRRIFSNNNFTVDQYDTTAWITVYRPNFDLSSEEEDLKKLGITGAIQIQKTKSNEPDKPGILFGEVPEKFLAYENGVQFEIRFQNTFHPGLFLDHQITREWLKQNSKNKTVLNLFSYTGSLAIAAAVGGAAETISIDLSNPSTQWAKENARLNGLGKEHQFIKGDVFDWTKRFEKKGRTFDIVISDPPSQSRSDKMHFSTAKHLDKLHELCLDCLASNGTLITSINTETLELPVMIASIHNTAKKMDRTIKSYQQLDLPEGFDSNFRSMKGLRVVLN